MAVFARSSKSLAAAARHSRRADARPAVRVTAHAALLLCASLAALAAPGAEAQTASSVTITGRLNATAPSVAGFGDVPLSRSPFQATSLSSSQLLDAGTDSLGEITKLDASVGDAYNSPGYWASVRVRGYALDNRFNFRRDGLPINGETALLLDNKERIEVLKGTSGAQAGTSAPGGLVNLVVKRPRFTDQTSVLLGASESGNLKLAVDADRRQGDDLAIRLNASVEKLDGPIRDTQGHRHLLAVAGEWRPVAGRSLEAEVEVSHQAQPSVPGFSLLGNTLPAASRIDPRTNLNNQPWSLPVVFDGSTASLRWTEALWADWRLQAQGMVQRLKTDDRIAFPFGCSSENVYDRYCSDGTMDLYDFRSEGEHRDSDALALTLSGRAHTAGFSHELSTGLTWSRYQARLGRQAYNYAGVGNIAGTAIVPAAAELTDENTNRSEHSTELHLRDVVSLSADAKLWLGLRHTRLSRDSVRTDGSRATAYEQSFTTPWIAATYQIDPSLMAYASWGQGVESDVAPNRKRYTNAGQVLPTLKSHQTELGLKQDTTVLGWSLTAFDIQRPLAVDAGSCDADGSCTRLIDGTAHHLGLEATADTRWNRLSLRGSAMWLKARHEGAANAADNGLIPTNVAEQSLRLQAGYQWLEMPGLSLQASLSREGRRMVLPDNSLQVPGWTTVGLGARLTRELAGHELTWRVGVDNVFDRRAWKESPYQYSHVYLYPLEPRTFRTSLQVSL